MSLLGAMTPQAGIMDLQICRPCPYQAHRADTERAGVTTELNSAHHLEGSPKGRPPRRLCGPAKASTPLVVVRLIQRTHTLQASRAGTRPRTPHL